MPEQLLNNDVQNRSSTSAMNTQEGHITKMIESQTAKIPSGTYLALAVGSMVVSLTLALIQNRDNKWANFIGQWAPSFLIMGLYNKIVKVEGSDRTESIH